MDTIRALEKGHVLQALQIRVLIEDKLTVLPLGLCSINNSHTDTQELPND